MPVSRSRRVWVSQRRIEIVPQFVDVYSNLEWMFVFFARG